MPATRRFSPTLALLRKTGMQRAHVPILKIVVDGSGVPAVNGEYAATDATEVPDGFGRVCREQGWDTQQAWQKLNGEATWYAAANGAYIYFNQADRHWWIDEPSGEGVFKAAAPAHAPPQLGWVELGASRGAAVPTLVATLRALRPDPALSED